MSSDEKLELEWTAEGDGYKVSGEYLRFNWGYHDGAADVTHKRPRRDMRHFNKSYGAGYDTGFGDAQIGDYHGDSNAAWKRRQLAETQGACEELAYALHHLAAFVRECASTARMYDDRRKACLECADKAIRRLDEPRM